MLEDLEKVIASLKYLRMKPKIDDYAWRFLIQKITYLAQALGMQTDYPFTIHVKGAYSYLLTCDYYEYAGKVSRLETSYLLTANDEMILDKIKSIVLEDCEVSDAANVRMQLLESVSTAVYQMKLNPQVLDDELFSKIKELKPYLSDYLVVVGINRAKALLFKEEYLTDELKKEIEEWDMAE